MTGDQRLGVVLGVLVGDAVGVPWEFHDPRNLPPVDALGPIPPDTFRRSHAGTPPGTWSDDGAHALALLDTLSTCGRWDAADFAARLVAWWHTGAYAVDGRVFDIGNQTSAVLSRLEAGVPATASGLSGERDNGNGSLMRVLPLAAWSDDAGPDLLTLAAETSAVTHAHPRSRVCCAMAVAWARAEAAGSGWDRAAAEVDAWVPPEWRADWATILRFGPPRGSGYVVDTLITARAALDGAPDFRTAVQRAIAYGLDTDTTAAVVGGIAGARFGAASIPAEWRALLRGEDVLRPILARWLGP